MTVINAVLQGNEQREIWSKAVACLTAIGRLIRFDVSDTSDSRISFSEAVFYDTFFREFSADIRGDSDVYSFQLDGKTLLPLFRRLEGVKDVEKIVFSVVDTEDEISPGEIQSRSHNTVARARRSDGGQFELRIEVKSIYELKKVYTIPYVINTGPRMRTNKAVYCRKSDDGSTFPSSMDPRDLTYSDLDCNFFAIETWTVKKLLEACTSSVEEFGLLFARDQVVFTGQTKSIKSDKGDILKHPMGTTIRLDVGEFLSCSVENGTGVKFQLRDFKTFVNIIVPFARTIEVYYNEPSEPICFEVNDNDRGFFMQLVQVTDTNDHIEVSSRPREGVTSSLRDGSRTERGIRTNRQLTLEREPKRRKRIVQAESQGESQGESQRESQRESDGQSETEEETDVGNLPPYRPEEAGESAGESAGQSVGQKEGPAGETETETETETSRPGVSGDEPQISKTREKERLIRQEQPESLVSWNSGGGSGSEPSGQPNIPLATRHRPPTLTRQKANLQSFGSSGSISRKQSSGRGLRGQGTQQGTFLAPEETIEDEAMEETQRSEIGPTQQVPKPKGLFE